MKKLLAIAYAATLVLTTVPAMTPEVKAETPAPKVPKITVKPTIKPVTKQKPVHPRVMAERATRAQFRSKREWLCLREIWEHESHFNPKARNKRSGAYGIAQFMPQTWGNYKVKKTSDPKLQIKYGLRYVTARYKTPCNALKFRKRHGYY